MTTRKLSTEQKADIKTAWANGADPFDLQLDYDIASSTLYRIVKGIPNGRGAKVGRPRSFDYDRAASLRASGLTPAVIAQRLGVSENTVFVALRRMAA